MKSRIRNSVAKIAIGVNIESEKAVKIEEICRKENVVFKPVQADNGGEQIGYLCGYKGFEKCKKIESTDKECLLFSTCDNKTINKILAMMRESGCTVDLKAMVTATNQSWTLCKLAEQLFEEHTQMNGGEKNG